MSLSNGKSIDLTGVSPSEMTAATTIVEDGSYRITLADRDGVTNGAQTEYFIRVLDDRPPDVHIVRPASDRSVTSLEEVDIEAQADDDYGLDRVELVYAVRGQAEKVVPLDIPSRATSATVRHTIYLEDLGVRPGDFVSYYVRARDITRGARPNEGRSDIFFLEVRPYEQEFALQQSQSMAGGGYSGSIDDLVHAQKQIVVATWKLDRRGGGGSSLRSAQSPQDVRAIGRTEAELKTRAEETASSLRESTMRDPRRRLQGRSSDSADGLRVGQTMPEEDAMTKAVEAMGRAVTALEVVNTGSALPPEMQALNALLEAQALVKRRQVSRQESAQGGPGNNNRNYDVSTLFDRELQRQQQTNYEARQPSGQKRADDEAEKIRSLARRQDELLRRQEELTRQQLSEDEKKRQLEKLTREQSELRQQTEEMARQTSKQQGGQSQESGASSKAQSGADQTSRQLQEIADDMRSATGDLRRLGANGGLTRGNDALEKLRRLERRLGGSEDVRKAQGDLQLEARELADAQRELATLLRKAPDARSTPSDRLRQLAGEEQRLAERARQLQEGARRNADVASADAVARQRLPERMQASANALRDAPKPPDATREAAAQEAIARDLDRTADVLQAGARSKDGASPELSAALTRARELREKLDAITRELQKPGSNGQRNQLRDEALHELQRTRELIDDLRRQDPSLTSGGPGFTFEGQGMTFSSPGTEAFKQDFARWQELRDEATRALAGVESQLSKHLQEKQAGDRLAAGVDDRVPAAYRSRVDDYFKAIASKKAP
jgi:hypothetical protein